MVRGVLEAVRAIGGERRLCGECALALAGPESREPLAELVKAAA